MLSMQKAKEINRTGNLYKKQRECTVQETKLKAREINQAGDLFKRQGTSTGRELYASII